NSRPDIPLSLASLSPLPNGWQAVPLIDDEMVPGVLEIETRGCAHATYLVVNGDTYSTIWNCWSIDEVSLTDLTFSVWYQQWISKMEEKALPILAREKEAEQIKEGMSEQEVIDVLGGECHVREIFGTHRRHLAFNNLATEFELNEDDMVIKRIEWPIIV
ncbi:MAG: hypothetical protein M3347_05270, partial [Armatimonadota bacterium]|nr:hypothetical protein [Armatimonadota bacterium]